MRFFSADETKREQAIVAVGNISFLLHGRFRFGTSDTLAPPSRAPSRQSIGFDKGTQLVIQEFLQGWRPLSE